MLLNPRTSLARRSRRSQEDVEDPGVVEEAVPEAVVALVVVDVAVAVASSCATCSARTILKCISANTENGTRRSKCGCNDHYQEADRDETRRHESFANWSIRC